MIEVDRSSPLPAYFQIAADLERRVTRGEWGPGTKLPSEIELSGGYGVTRMTLRQALAELSKSGLIEVRRGKGAFVSGRRRPIVWNLDLTFGGVNSSLRAEGHELSGEVVFARLESSTDRIGRVLGDPRNVFHMERVIFADGAPIAVHRSWFDAEVVPGIDTLPGLEGPLADLIRDTYSLAANTASSQLEVVRATAAEASQLHVRAETPLFMVTGTSLMRSGRPLEHYELAIVSAGVVFRVEAHAG